MSNYCESSYWNRSSQSGIAYTSGVFTVPRVYPGPILANIPDYHPCHWIPSKPNCQVWVPDSSIGITYPIGTFTLPSSSITNQQEVRKYMEDQAFKKKKMEDQALSYSTKLVVNILKELGIVEYKTQSWGREGWIATQVIVMIRGQRLSIVTHPAGANDAFCETMGVTPHDWEEDDPVRHATPELFKEFMLKLQL